AVSGTPEAWRQATNVPTPARATSRPPRTARPPGSPGERTTTRRCGGPGSSVGVAVGGRAVVTIGPCHLSPAWSPPVVTVRHHPPGPATRRTDVAGPTPYVVVTVQPELTEKCPNNTRVGNVAV